MVAFLISFKNVYACILRLKKKTKKFFKSYLIIKYFKNENDNQKGFVK